MYSEKILENVADSLGVNKDKLKGLILFESNFNPKARNPYSSAGGLLQFIDSTAQSLGFQNTTDLINKLPTADLQLQYAVLPYLNRYKPYSTVQSLYMAVFYPPARYWPETRQFPDYIKKVNPGINTPLDYMRYVYKKLSLRYIPRVLYLGLGIFLYHLFKRGVHHAKK